MSNMHIDKYTSSSHKNKWNHYNAQIPEVLKFLFTLLCFTDKIFALLPCINICY